MEQKCKICKNFKPDKHISEYEHTDGICILKKSPKYVHSSWGCFCDWFELKEVNQGYHP